MRTARFIAALHIAAAADAFHLVGDVLSVVSRRVAR